MVFNIFLLAGTMGAGDNEMADNIVEILRLSLGIIGDEFGTGGGVALGVVVVVCLAVMWLSKGVFGWVAAGLLLLMTLSGFMVKGEVGLGKAFSDFLIMCGFGMAVITTIFDIITGKYWRIKSNLIFAGVCIVLGTIIGKLV